MSLKSLLKNFSKDNKLIKENKSSQRMYDKKDIVGSVCDISVCVECGFVTLLHCAWPTYAISIRNPTPRPPT
jgi:hypothetical protein